jgi:hypothetical protein
VPRRHLDSTFCCIISIKNQQKKALAQSDGDGCVYPRCRCTQKELPLIDLTFF